jgi:hypothetical protein
VTFFLCAGYLFHSHSDTLGSKAPAQTEKLKALQKPILSFFHNVIHMLSQVTDHEIVQRSLTESAKLIPYIASSRKAVKLYLKVTYLRKWSTCICVLTSHSHRNAWNFGLAQMKVQKQQHFRRSKSLPPQEMTRSWRWYSRYCPSSIHNVPLIKPVELTGNLSYTHPVFQSHKRIQLTLNQPYEKFCRGSVLHRL